MASYNQIDIETKKCHLSGKEISDSDSYLVCEHSKHYYLKKSLKTEYRGKYDEQLDAGYIYSSGNSSNYKKHKCPCGTKLKTHNNFKVKVKKAMKYSPLLLIVLI